MPALYLATGREAGDEISSTYEGRHITLEESYLTHPTHTDGFVDKGDPVIVGDIIGVALLSAAAATDLISIDTEGIWFLSAVAEDDDGNSAIAPGDLLYLNKSTCILSKNSNKQSHQRFGYSLGVVATGTTAVVAVKVHWNPDDAEELVGTTAVPLVSTKNGHIFREYRVEPQGTGGHRAIYANMELTTAASWGDAVRGRAMVNAACPGTVDGGHFGIEFDTDGVLSGLGVGLRGTYMAKNAAAAASIAGAMSELYAAGDATNYATATEHSIHRFVNDGDATGKATAQNVFSFAGLSAIQNQAHNAWVAGLTRSLRVIVDGAVYYLGLSNAP